MKKRNKYSFLFQIFILKLPIVVLLLLWILLWAFQFSVSIIQCILSGFIMLELAFSI